MPFTNLLELHDPSELTMMYDKVGDICVEEFSYLGLPCQKLSFMATHIKCMSVGKKRHFECEYLATVETTVKLKPSEYLLANSE